MYDGDDKNKTAKCNQWEYFGYIGDTIVSEVTEWCFYCTLSVHLIMRLIVRNILTIKKLIVEFRLRSHL